jgi:type IV pilus assembly protein PilM
MLNFLNKKIEAFGLDISTKSLKILQIKKKKDNFYITSFVEEKIPEGIIKEGFVEKEEDLAKIIQNALKKVKGDKIKTPFVVASLPEEKTYLEILKLPKLSDEELNKAIELNAEMYIPLSLKDCYFNFKKVQEKDNNIEILLSVAPKNLVDGYLRTLEMAKLKPIGLEIESEAIVKAIFLAEKPKDPVLIVDFGETRTGLIIYSNEIRATSTIPVSSEIFTLAIAKSLKINFEKAEELKKEKGLFEKDNEIFDALIPPLKDLLDQIKIYLDYYQSRKYLNASKEDNKKISKIILCGGGANLKGFSNVIQTMINIETELANPLKNIFVSEKLKFTKEESLSFTTAIGLALESFEIKEIYD